MWVLLYFFFLIVYIDSEKNWLNSVTLILKSLLVSVELNLSDLVFFTTTLCFFTTIADFVFQNFLYQVKM